MTKEQKNEVIEVLKGKFSQYNNFYITNTESLSVEQVGKLRRACFDKNVEMKVAKNTLIKKALESIGVEIGEDGSVNMDELTRAFDNLDSVDKLLDEKSKNKHEDMT